MKISVVYLAYYNEQANYDLNVVEDFLYSYEKYQSGYEHSLVIITKNWTDQIKFEKFSAMAQKCKAKVVNLPDDGWDLGAYFRIVHMLDSEYVLFLGSSSKILCNNWLSCFVDAFNSDETIKLAGTMGSWGLIAGENELDGVTFPNYHIRTCSFIINRKLFLEYVETHKFPMTKKDTYNIEHGTTSITKFILDKGYKAVVVNSDGQIFKPENWWQSKTFRTPDANKSIISDRLSENYFVIPPEYLDSVERTSWGQNLRRTKTKIFVSYNELAPLLQSEVFQPIFLNSNVFEDKTFALRDNIGKNISFKYPYYGSLTAQYWVGENYIQQMDIEYIGFCKSDKVFNFNSKILNNSNFQPIVLAEFANQIRDFTEEKIANIIGDFNVVLPSQSIINSSISKMYEKLYSQDVVNAVFKTVRQVCPQYEQILMNFMNSNKMYNLQAFIMKKDLMHEYLQWLFNVLNVFEEEVEWLQNEGANKIVEDISEIFFNVWFVDNVVNKGLKVLNLPGFSIYYDMSLYIAECLTQVGPVAF